MGSYVINDAGAMVWEDESGEAPPEPATKNDSEPEAEAPAEPKPKATKK